MSRKQTPITVGQNNKDSVGIEAENFVDETQTADAEPKETSLIPINHHSFTTVKEQSPTQNQGVLASMQEEIILKNPSYLEDFRKSYDVGEVDLAFPENLNYESSSECYPKSYYTLSGKERLLLLFAENFRRQFHSVYPKRRPLVLAVKNECDVQKLVCTTIRPTAFVFTPLISSLDGCASFVADFIEYQPLKKPCALSSLGRTLLLGGQKMLHHGCPAKRDFTPPRLVSPSTLLRCRHGNSFEMATLLCSMLIGAGFPAMVVSGSAKLETVNNDQRNIEFPLPEDDENLIDKNNEIKLHTSEENDKYKLKPKPDLESHLSEKLAQMKIDKESRERFELEESERIKREAFEDEVSFNDPNRLSHSWVVIVENAPWSCQPRKKIIDEDGEEVDSPPSAIFIEPSTGFKHDPSTKAYIHIESVWNHLNYYVNLQNCRIRDMKWDLRETSEWEHFLAGEPPEMRVVEDVSDENLIDQQKLIAVEKHLDIGRSWVEKLQINEKDFDERFPNLQKAIHFKNILHERFSSYTQPDGKVKQLTLFSDDDYGVPEVRWDWYENRSDLLSKVKFVFSTGQTEEYFLKGRPDCLRHFIHNVDEKQPKMLHFFSAPRVDSMGLCEIHENKIVLHFEKSPGSCYYKEFKTKYDMTKLLEITEKFQRDPTKPADKDIAVRSFLLSQNKIILKYHYIRGALTAATREFIKPPKPDYGQEIIFDPALTKGYKFGISEQEPTDLELYLLLLDQLKSEDAAKKAFDKHMEELNGIFERRKQEIKNTILKFGAFDPLRNTLARKQRIEREEMEEQIKSERRANLPDFLAPYLVAFGGRTLTQKESWNAYNACLNDLKTRFTSLLNELQRRYEDLTAEAQSLKKFLNKFQNKFDDNDYERLLQESKDVELNKRMVQKRLTITHEEAQKKYDLVKQSLLKDKRLQLKSVSVLSDPKNSDIFSK